MNKSQNKYTKRPQKRGRAREKKQIPEKSTQFDKPREQSEQPDCNKKGENDFSWYNKYPSLIAGSASIPFPYKPGMMITAPMTVSGIGGVNDRPIHTIIPGVIAIEWVPFVGKATEMSDPINVISQQLYAQVRNSFSGTLQAEGSDFIIYMLSLDSIFSYIGALKRIYRLINRYNPLNYDIPDTLLHAIGINRTVATKLREEKTKLWTYINELVHLANQFVCPAVMDYFNRHYWMNDNVYTDAPSVSSQLFCFVQKAFFKFTAFDAAESENITYGCDLVLAPWFSTVSVYATNIGTDVELLRLYGLDLINALAQWDTAFQISGYLMRAFQNVKPFAVVEEPLFSEFTPIYSEEVLSQIENASGFPFVANTDKISLSGMRVQQSTNYPGLSCPANVVWSTTATSVNNCVPMQMGSYGPTFVNIHKDDNPSAEKVVIATRLKSRYSTDALHLDDFPMEFPSGGANLTLTVTAASEAVLSMFLFKAAPSLSSEQAKADGSKTLISNFIVTGKWIEWILDIPQFDWAPMSFAYKYIASGDSSYWNCIPFGDVDNLTEISTDQYVQINKMCLYSEFNAFLF